MKARILPAVLSIILPIIIFNHFFASVEFSKFVGNVFGIIIISNITISTICLYFLSEFGRVLGKNIFEKKLFDDEKKMPTTTLMLFKDNTYSDEYKYRFRNKVKKDFQFNLLNKDEENNDEDLAKIKIVEIMALIRKKLKNNKFLLQHNIEYGALRNLIGGAVLGVILSLFNVIFFSYLVVNGLAYTISLVLLIIYLVLVLLNRPIIKFYSRNYAKILFREYM